MSKSARWSSIPRRFATSWPRGSARRRLPTGSTPGSNRGSCTPRKPVTTLTLDPDASKDAQKENADKVEPAMFTYQPGDRLAKAGESIDEAEARVAQRGIRGLHRAAAVAGPLLPGQRGPAGGLRHVHALRDVHALPATRRAGRARSPGRRPGAGRGHGGHGRLGFRRSLAGRARAVDRLRHDDGHCLSPGVGPVVHGRRFLDRRAGAGREPAHVPPAVRHDGRGGAEPGPHPQPQQADLCRPLCRLRGRLAGSGHEHDRQSAPGLVAACAMPAINSSGPRWPGSS